MFKQIALGVTAVAIVLLCSVDVNAQQQNRQGAVQNGNNNRIVTNRTVNVYNNGGYRGNGYGYRGGYGYYGGGGGGCVGCWPGSGPYDSAIAVAGIAAGAAVLTAIINRPPAVVAAPAPAPVYAGPVYPPANVPPGCYNAMFVDQYGRQIIRQICN